MWIVAQGLSRTPAANAYNGGELRLLFWLIGTIGFQAYAQSARLEPGVELTARLEIGAQQRHTFHLDRGETAEILVTRLCDAEVRILAPDGAVLYDDAHVSHFGLYPVWVTAASAGDYTLELKAEDIRGTYRVKVVARRPTQPHDANLIAAQQSRAKALAMLPNMERVGAALDQAEPLARQAGDKRVLAELLTNSADVKYNLDDKRGRAVGEEAVALAVELQDRYAESEARFVYSKLLALVGETAKAIDQLEIAIARSSEISDPNGLSKALNLSGSIYSIMGQRERALQYYSRSLPIFRDLGIERYVASAQFSIGRTLTAMGRAQEGAKPLDEALAIYRKIGEKRNQALVLEAMAQGATNQKQEDRAASLYEQVIAINRELKSDRLVARGLTDLAILRRDQGNWMEARTQLTEAMSLLAPYGGVDLARARVQMARLETLHGSAERAIELCKLALADVERLTELAGGLEAQATYFAGFRGAYGALVDALRKAGKEEEAFQVSERSRARALAAMLVSKKIDLSAGADEQLRKSHASLERSIAAKLREQTALERRKHTAAEAEAVTRQIEELRHQQDRLQAKIRDAHPNYASITQYKPLDTEVFRKALDEDTVLIEFLMGQRTSHAWAVTRDGVKGATLPGREEIARLAREAYDALTARNRKEPGPEADAAWKAKSAALSGMLLKPLGAAIERKRWIIVADDALHYIPFAALAPDRDVVNLPSASVLAVLRETPEAQPVAKALAIFADPVFEREDTRLKAGTTRAALEREGQLLLPRLPFTRREAEGIAAALPPAQVKMYTGFDATRAAATDPSLAGYRILHFATHGVLNEDAPELSGVVLSLFDAQSRALDGFLRLHELYQLKLNADLVVLSACQTGLGKKMEGEGVIGLTRGMMYAGAARVVASLWKVDDAATAEFMRLFYQALLKEQKPASEALHQAQRQLAAQRRWRSPYYWAAFQLHGEYR